MEDEFYNESSSFSFSVPSGFLAPYPLMCGRKKITEAFHAPVIKKSMLIYIVHGNGQCATNEGSGIYGEDCVIYAFAGQTLDLEPQTSTEYLFLILENGSPLPAPLPPGPRYPLEANGPVRHMLERLCRNGATGRAGSIYDAAADTFRLLMKLCSLCVLKEKSFSPVVTDAIDCMRNHFAFLTGMDDLALRIGVSKCHLIRLFSKEMGMTPGSYLQNVRLENAMLLLRGREYSIDAVAGLCGFSGANYFCKVFRKAVGESPGEYRGRSLIHGGVGIEGDRRLIEVESHSLL